jgi:hypothetical protein
VAPVTVTSSTASRRGVTIEKNPSPDWKLLFTFTPSSITLIVFCGRPLIVDPRGPPAVSTPGMNTTKFSAFRDTRGRLAICSVVMVEDTVAILV